MELREKELACEIVRDLLPLYVDGMVSDVSKKGIDNHLEHCTECSEIYHDMACHLEMETPSTEISDVKRFLHKTKKMYLLYGLGCLSFYCNTGLSDCGFGGKQRNYMVFDCRNLLLICGRFYIYSFNL